MSDKQKSLIKAFEEVLPNSDHRFCVRHLLGNFTRRGFRGLAFKNALWKAIRATTENEFTKSFSELTNLDDDVAEWFSDKPPQHWCKAFFNTYPKCDMLLNNCCETFNSNILPAREMPILSMWEWIMEYLMKRLQVNRDRAKASIKWKGYLCPKIRTICYTVDTYRKVYAPSIMPINGRNEWKKSDFTPPLPPNSGRSSGRPCSARRMEVDEVQPKQKKRSRGKPKLVNNPFKLKRQQKLVYAANVVVRKRKVTSVRNSGGQDKDDTSHTPQFRPYPDPYYLDPTAAVSSNEGTSSGVPRATTKAADAIPPKAATSKVQKSRKMTQKPPAMPRKVTPSPAPIPPKATTKVVDIIPSKVTPRPTRIFSSPGPSMHSQLQQEFKLLVVVVFVFCLVIMGMVDEMVYMGDGRNWGFALQFSQEMFGFLDGEYSMPTPTIIDGTASDGLKQVPNKAINSWRRFDRLFSGWITGHGHDESKNRIGQTRVSKPQDGKAKEIPQGLAALNIEHVPDSEWFSNIGATGARDRKF
ncbi:hypothetical protein BUALT_Bualt15G0097800 [Buddleja alternifolia]|uniref:MULE transposase domain-containing protein n=1 Tax=Buddleja alternifolia TaxID=168488 RepID=A0AAV6WKN7_9LAMI|nr:hypothetical protein BUALT_Bualt15G0097800 [Buddleja alternifolia]